MTIMKDVRDTIKWADFVQTLNTNAEYIDVDKLLEVMEENGMIKIEP